MARKIHPVTPSGNTGNLRTYKEQLLVLRHVEYEVKTMQEYKFLYELVLGVNYGSYGIKQKEYFTNIYTQQSKPFKYRAWLDSRCNHSKEKFYESLINHNPQFKEVVEMIKDGKLEEIHFIAWY